MYIAATDSMFTWSLHDLCEKPSPVVVFDQLQLTQWQSFKGDGSVGQDALTKGSERFMQVGSSPTPLPLVTLLPCNRQSNFLSETSCYFLQPVL